jgi:tRNA A-37 threonylcarbamoyl transferase component Bud32
VTSSPAHAVRRLKDAGRHSVWLIQRPGEQPRTLKSWPLIPLMLVKAVLGLSQPQRQIRGSRRVARAGIPTPEVIGWRVTWVRPWPRLELELAWAAGECLADLVSPVTMDDAGCRRISAAVGRVVRELIDAGLFNRDLKLANLIVASDAGSADVWLIDTVGVRRLRRPVDEIARMLERVVEKAAGANASLRPPVWMPALRQALAGLEAPTRRAVVRRLQARRRQETG